MALINCPECNKQVSSQARFCPNCGFQIANYIYQKEQRELTNKKIAEQEKRKQLRKTRFKEHKIKYILVISVSLVLVVALVAGSILLFNRLQIKTFNSESDMKSYVEGVYIEEHNTILNYRITIKDDYIIKEEYGTMKNYPVYGKDTDRNEKTHSYHISKYDFKNGKIITDKYTHYYKVKDENANDLTSTIEKSEIVYSQDEFIVKIDNTITTEDSIYKRTY